jgi:hypothetical protein
MNLSPLIPTGSAIGVSNQDLKSSWQHGLLHLPTRSNER